MATQRESRERESAPDLCQHFVDFALDLVVPILTPIHRFAVHFVDAHDHLLDAQQVAQSRMLPGLALDLALFVVSFGDRRLETTFVRRHHQQSNVRLRRPGNHVFDEIPVPKQRTDTVHSVESGPQPTDSPTHKLKESRSAAKHTDAPARR